MTHRFFKPFKLVHEATATIGRVHRRLRQSTCEKCIEFLLKSFWKQVMKYAHGFSPKFSNAGCSY